jgi:hypothetical protein
MKKYLIPIIILCLIGVCIFTRHRILAPAQAAARDLAAINGLMVGQTTEAELLGRNAFQTANLNCAEGFCIYSTERENTLLSMFHLAPRTVLSTEVMVRDGVVSGVFVIMSSHGLMPIVVAQTMKLPAGCAAGPCLKPALPFDKYLRNISIVFGNESELRNHWQQIFDTACLSRLHGCKTTAEFVPITKNLNLEAAAH